MTFDSLPDHPSPDRERAILDAVRAGRHDPPRWAAVHSVAHGHAGIVYVSEDVLTIEGLRVSVTHATAQRIADALGTRLPTSRISDLAHGQAAVKLRAQLQAADAAMANTTRMRAYHAAVEAVRGGRGGLLSTLGKDWILSNSQLDHPLGAQRGAINYGMHDVAAIHRGPTGLAVWQPVGRAHDVAHVDYSQVVRLCRADCVVDGMEHQLDDVLVDRDLCWLFSDEGMLKLVRHPGVPYVSAGATTDPAPPPSGREVPVAITPLSLAEMALALRDGHVAAFNRVPSVERVGVALAQNLLETARGRTIRNFNFGNVTAFGSWHGDYFALHVPPPDPPLLHFRAFPSALEGAADYWRVLAGRAAFAAALPYFDRGDPQGAAIALGTAHYFLAPIPAYAAGMVGLYHEVMRDVLPGLPPPDDLKTVRDDVVIEALDRVALHADATRAGRGIGLDALEDLHVEDWLATSLGKEGG